MMTKLLNHVLFFVSGFLPCKIIYNDLGEPYLERYMLLRWGLNGEKTLFLHRFLDSDSDRGVHDHPWNSRSFILCGGYHEKRYFKAGEAVSAQETDTFRARVVTRDIKPFSFNEIGKNDFHRIVLKSKVPVWTIFYHGDRVKHWGFLKFDYVNATTCEINEDNITFEPYEDKTNPTERWELTAKKGRHSARENVDYLYQKA